MNTKTTRAFVTLIAVALGHSGTAYAEPFNPLCNITCPPGQTATCTGLFAYLCRLPGQLADAGAPYTPCDGGECSGTDAGVSEDATAILGASNDRTVGSAFSKGELGDLSKTNSPARAGLKDPSGEADVDVSSSDVGEIGGGGGCTVSRLGVGASSGGAAAAAAVGLGLTRLARRRRKR